MLLLFFKKNKKNNFAASLGKCEMFGTADSTENQKSNPADCSAFRLFHVSVLVC